MADVPRTVTLPVPTRSQVRRGVVWALGLGLILYLAWVVREIWVPLGLAVVIATVLDPVVDRMERRGWTRPRATAFIFGAFLLVTAGLLYIGIPLIAREVAGLQDGITRVIPDTSPQGIRRQFSVWNAPDWLGTIAAQTVQGARAGIQRSSTWLTEYGMSFLSNLIWIVIIPIVAFYLLRDFHLILAKGLLLVPPKRREAVQTIVGEVSGVFAKYLKGLAIVSALNGVATWLLLTAFRMPSAVLLGVLAGVLYSVPYIGAIITILLTMAVAFIADGPQYMLVVTAASLVLHQILFDQIIAPRILGGQVGLHPILSIVALLIGNLLLGIIGMILAVPIAACIQIGVLAVVPKLRVEIDLEGGDEEVVHAVVQSEDAKSRQIAQDATEDLHRSVSAAVEQIESKITERSD